MSSTKQKQNNRYTEVDIARGIGIFFVVLGHSIKQTGVSAGWIRILTYIIYSFHMPLFFCLSGFVSAKILKMNRRERGSYILGRARRLLVPYFVIGLLYIPVKLAMNDVAIKPFQVSDIWKLLIGQNPNVSLWFLFILFVIELICVILVNTFSFRSVWYGSFFLSLAIYWANFDIRTPKYLFFFLMGIWVRLKFEDSRAAGYEDAMDGQDLLAFLALVVDIFAIIFLYRTTITITMMVTSLCGIYLVLWGSSRMVYNIDGERREPGSFTRKLLLLGLFSMDIYILHEPIMTIVRLVIWNRLGWNYIVCTILIFFCALCFPIPVSRYIIRRIKPLRMLLLGEKR